MSTSAATKGTPAFLPLAVTMTADVFGTMPDRARFEHERTP
ncbi:hypothetical protein [Roseiconus lacunae]|nr:hypothetical protein [Roseiconus lacunae]